MDSKILQSIKDYVEEKDLEDAKHAIRVFERRPQRCHSVHVFLAALAVAATEVDDTALLWKIKLAIEDHQANGGCDRFSLKSTWNDALQYSAYYKKHKALQFFANEYGKVGLRVLIIAFDTFDPDWFSYALGLESGLHWTYMSDNGVLKRIAIACTRQIVRHEKLDMLPVLLGVSGRGVVAACLLAHALVERKSLYVRAALDQLKAEKVNVREHLAWQTGIDERMPAFKFLFTETFSNTPDLWCVHSEEKRRQIAKCAYELLQYSNDPKANIPYHALPYVLDTGIKRKQLAHRDRSDVAVKQPQLQLVDALISHYRSVVTTTVLCMYTRRIPKAVVYSCVVPFLCHEPVPGKCLSSTTGRLVPFE